MKTTGFFAITISVSEPEHQPSGYSVHLGWIEGVPYVIDLGAKILVNGAAVAPNTPVILQEGDTVTIGSTRLTWNAGVEAVAKPGAAEESSVPEPSQEASDEPATADGAVLVQKQVAEQIKDKASDPTLLLQEKPARAPSPKAPDDQATVLGQAAEASSDLGAYGTVWIDMAQVLAEQPDLEFVSTTILRDTRVPHLAIHAPNRTWEVPLTGEAMTIGRADDASITIPDDSVSQRHALIEQIGKNFVIRDTQSKNGVWLGKQRIEEHTLTSGDVLNLGRAKLVFKGGFTSDDLTLIGTPRIDGKPTRRPVVFVPGLMGSQLWLGSDRIWPEPKLILSNPEIFSLPGDPRIEARGIVNDVVIVPHIVQSRQYSAMGDYMVSGLGYTRGKDLLEFSYDWRQDIRLSAQLLGEAIENWGVKAPVTIIGHSLGTLVSRYYVEKLGGKKAVERIILMGGPHYGTPKGVAILLTGPGLLPFGLGDERMRKVLSTFHSAYQILPTYPCVTDQNGNHIDVMENGAWLPEENRHLLSLGRSFQSEVGETSSIPAVSIFGYGLKTKLRIKVERGSDGAWEKVDFVEEMGGDQSVPAGSAVLKDSEIHPVLQEHGSLYVDDDVRMRLKVELTRSTTWQGKGKK